MFHETACRKERELLLETFMSGRELPAGLARHLEECASCRGWWEALGAVREGLAQPPLYSPALREKTLGRLAARKPDSGLKWLPLVVPAALASLSISLLVPGWLLSRWFLGWTESAAIAYGAGFGALVLVGTAGTALTAMALAQRDFIHFCEVTR
ncbi:MAG: hypothetical protein GXY47_17130 [Acidobacteria bacterium]|nr:hypothetical protein [Acidobacteriota bacterium]